MNTCKHCNREVTRADQKYAFVNLQINGYDKQTLKSIFPSHLKCAKQYLKENNIAPIEGHQQYSGKNDV